MMTGLFAGAHIFLLLLVSACFVPGLSIAAHKKVTGGGGTGYVIQLGAFKDLKNAEQMINGMRSTGVELFLARKDNGMYVVQSQRFASKDKAQALAARLVAGKWIGSYFITAAPGTVVSWGARDDEASESPPAELVPMRKKEVSKASLLFTLLETEPDKLKEIAATMLEANPGDRAALSALAWHQLRHERFEEAYTYFSELNRLEPEQTDHVTGMIYALSGMKELEKVMELAPAVSLFFYNRSSGLRK